MVILELVLVFMEVGKEMYFIMYLDLNIDV